MATAPDWRLAFTAVTGWKGRHAIDAHRFDTLTRSLTSTRSRRGLVRLLGGLSLSGVLIARSIGEAAAALLNGGSSCTRDGQCKTGECVGPAGKQKCSCSGKYPTCKQPNDPCKKSTCDVDTKRCVIKNKARGTHCGTGKICQNGICTHSAGTCTEATTPPDNCGTLACNNRPDCTCYVTIGGGVFCGNFQEFAQCVNCNSDNDCDAAWRGAACVSVANGGAICGSSCSTTDHRLCVAPCGPPR